MRALPLSAGSAASLSQLPGYSSYQQWRVVGWLNHEQHKKVWDTCDTTAIATMGYLRNTKEYCHSN